MLCVVATKKDVETAVRDLEGAVRRNKFGVLYVHSLKQTLDDRGGGEAERHGWAA